jgi:hypothetical protein
MALNYDLLPADITIPSSTVSIENTISILNVKESLSL